MKKLTLFVLIGMAVSVAAVKFPAPRGLYHDGPGVIAPAERQQIEAVMSDLQHATGAQLAVVVVPSLEGLTVEEYANQLFNRWGVGHKGKDDGVLILVALQDRRMRIEVGYGLEAQLPDGLCGDIIRQQMTPAFKAEHYGAGILAAAQRISAILRGDASAREVPDPDNKESAIVLLTMIISAFVIVGGVMVGCGWGSKTWFPIFFGGFMGGMATLIGMGFLYEVHVRNAWMGLFPAVYLFSIGWMYRKVQNTPSLRQTLRGKKRPFYDDDWSFGPTGSGSGGDSGGSDGGGGSSGGGGASGSW